MDVPPVREFYFSTLIASRRRVRPVLFSHRRVFHFSATLLRGSLSDDALQCVQPCLRGLHPPHLVLAGGRSAQAREPFNRGPGRPASDRALLPVGLLRNSPRSLDVSQASRPDNPRRAAQRFNLYLAVLLPDLRRPYRRRQVALPQPD